MGVRESISSPSFKMAVQGKAYYRRRIIMKKFIAVIVLTLFMAPCVFAAGQQAKETAGGQIGRAHV